MTLLKDNIARYKECSGHSFLSLKAVLFDMDGVLFNSMPYHADAWQTVMARHGMPMEREEVYLNEGRTGAGTIDMIHRRTFGTPAPEALIKQIYQEKCEEFSKNPEPQRITGARELLEKVRSMGLTAVLVTGSGQSSLFSRIERDYPGCFAKEHMVTAFDVKFGKPNPEPYLMGLEKAGVRPQEAVVIENAPIGVRAGVAAGIFTIAVNTGPLKPQVLSEEGAGMVYPSMTALMESWEQVVESFR